jgi:hypothetical protein
MAELVLRERKEHKRGRFHPKSQYYQNEHPPCLFSTKKKVLKTEEYMFMGL